MAQGHVAGTVSISTDFQLMCIFVQPAKFNLDKLTYDRIQYDFEVKCFFRYHFITLNIPFSWYQKNLGLMALIYVAPVPVVLEVARLVPQLKARAVLRGVRAILTLSSFYDAAFQFHPRLIL